MQVPNETRVAVVGHCEWAEFAVVERLPHPGEIVQASETWSEAAGGGAVAAVQIAKLAGECLFLTATGDDDLGDRVIPDLERHGVTVRAGRRGSSQRKAFVHLDQDGERTITTLGPRLSPYGADQLDWETMDEIDAVYVTAGDLDAVRAAARARHVVATIRAAESLLDSGIRIDALLASRNDPGERVETADFKVPPLAVVRTDGRRGGTIETADGKVTDWPAVSPTGRIDSYGAGDSFAGGLTFGLALGLPLVEAVSIAAFCGARNVTGRGPYSAQATASDLAAWRESRR